MGFAGVYFPDSYSDEMDELITKLNEEADIVVVYFHWGIEGDRTPMASQREIAKACIDHGVDLVIGAHPHVLQKTETYKGKQIIYSLGNFCFGGNKNPSDKDTMIYQHTFILENKEIVEESNNEKKSLLKSVFSNKRIKEEISWRLHCVKNEKTYEEIANKYDVNLEKLMAINKNEKLEEGKLIFLPLE